jgi:hypothetical protein
VSVSSIGGGTKLGHVIDWIASKIANEGKDTYTVTFKVGVHTSELC